jgi:hypothetical protein
MSQHTRPTPCINVTFLPTPKSSSGGCQKPPSRSSAGGRTVQWQLDEEGTEYRDEHVTYSQAVTPHALEWARLCPTEGSVSAGARVASVHGTAVLSEQLPALSTSCKVVQTASSQPSSQVC